MSIAEKVCVSLMLCLIDIISMNFVQYSYPNRVQGKIFGLLTFSYLIGLLAIPVVGNIKADFITGRKVYMIVISAVITILLSTLFIFGLLAIGKARFQNMKQKL